MSLQVLHDLGDYLTAATLLDGYNLLYNRWTDQAENGAGDFALIRTAGPGSGNRIQRRHDIDLYLVAEPGTTVAAQDRITAIRDYLAQATQPPNVVRYAVASNPTGPFDMTNGRQVFMLPVMAYTAEALA